MKNHPNIMFELANEPINILGPDVLMEPVRRDTSIN